MCGILTDKPEEKSPFGRPGFTLEDNIKTDLKEIGCDGVNWNHMSQDWVQLWPIMNMVMDLQVL
jgi:hypothetical protein